MTQQDRDQGGVSPLAEAAGYAGLLPFLGALLGVGLLPTFEQRDLAQRLALGYGASILSFVGAVHWGLALAGRWTWSPTVVGGAILPEMMRWLWRDHEVDPDPNNMVERAFRGPAGRGGGGALRD